MKEDEEKKKIFTERDLKAFDGGEEKPIYIAYQGKVYDVSGSLHS
jgi:predicted heme/steroid binding protein